MQIRIKRLREDVPLPRYAHGAAEDAGMDLCATADVVLLPQVPTLVRTGLSVEIPPYYVGKIHSRSGLALKHGLRVANAPGVVDASYRGEVGVILLWDGFNPTVWRERYQDTAWIREIPINLVPGLWEPRNEYGLEIRKGDRIAQLIVSRYEPVEWIEADELAASARSTNGFGSTGTR